MPTTRRSRRVAVIGGARQSDAGDCLYPMQRAAGRGRRGSFVLHDAVLGGVGSRAEGGAGTRVSGLPAIPGIEVGGNTSKRTGELAPLGDADSFEHRRLPV